MNFEIDTTQTEPSPTKRALIRDSVMVTVRRLLEKSGSHEEFVSAFFAFCNQTFQSVVGRCELQVGTERRQLIHAHEGLTEHEAIQFDRGCLQPAVQHVRAESPTKPIFNRVPVKGGSPLASIAVPLLNFRTGELDGVMALLVSDSDGQAAHVVARLDASLALMSASRETMLPAISTADPGILATANIAKFESVDQFAFDLTNSLCNRLNCEQVAFGLEHHHRIRVVAISGMAAFKASSPGVALTRQAMEECLDAGRLLFHQPDQQDEVHALHRQWSAETGGICVMSSPMMAGEDVVGVISLRRTSDRPFTEAERGSIAGMIHHYGSAVRLLDRATQPLSKQIRRSASATVKKNRTPLRLAMLACAVAGLLWFAFGTMTYQPVCDSTVTSSQLVHFSAPFDSQLKSVHVRNGEAVKKGALLAKFDTKELQLELHSVQAELSETAINFREAMQSGDASGSALYRAHTEVLNATADALQERIRRATLVAPDDGVVTDADLSRRIGQVFPQGERILSFAVGNAWIVEVSVPDHVASFVENGQTGAFRATTRPDINFDLQLVEVNGSASVLDGRNVFMAKAELDAKPDWMRNGMKGFATIETGQQPVWWVCTHGVLDWFRVNLWW